MVKSSAARMLQWSLPRDVATSIVFFVLLLLGNIHPVDSINCFVCHSVNKSNPDCEDPFNGNHLFYKTDCMAGRKNRSGQFPGTSCIKFTAWRDDYTVVVRDCTVDNGDTTSDTEMGRESHCWMVNMVNYNDVSMHGCALACNTDGCNTGNDVRFSVVAMVAIVFAHAAVDYVMMTSPL